MFVGWFSLTDVQLALPQLGSTVEEGTNSTTEIDIIFFEADDFTLRSELSCEMRENVAVERNGIAVQIPYVSGSEHGAVLDVAFVEGNEKYFSPYSTNMGIVKGVDIIEETEGGVVTLYKGHDVLVFEIQKDAECLQKEEQVLAQHMQEVIGKTFHATSYPLPFDFWGCSSLGWNVSFCQVLKEKECEIQRFGGDVCTITKFTKAHFCPANFTLVNATGFFREELPFFTTFPLESLESATYSNEHSNGIVYPCLSW